jgi:DNA-binding transcriptional LysR family regulator
MSDFNGLMIFATVVKAKSFSEAARRLKMPLTSVSRRVAELEDQLGVRLLERSTRSLRLTEVGAEVLEYAQRTLEISEAVDSIVSNHQATVSGVLRLSAPPNISDSFLTPLLCAFRTSYPNVRIQALITERHIDHIADGVDLAFRVGLLKDASLVARRLLSYRHLLVASPEYLKKAAPPQKPSDLLGHPMSASRLTYRASETRAYSRRPPPLKMPGGYSMSSSPASARRCMWWRMTSAHGSPTAGLCSSPGTSNR